MRPLKHQATQRAAHPEAQELSERITAFFNTLCLYVMIVSSGGVRSLLRCPGLWVGGLFGMCGPAGCRAERGVA